MVVGGGGGSRGSLHLRSPEQTIHITKRNKNASEMQKGMEIFFSQCIFVDVSDFKSLWDQFCVETFGESTKSQKNRSHITAV